MDFTYKLNGKKVTLEYRGPNPSGMQLQFHMSTGNFGNGELNRNVEKLDRDTIVTIKLEGTLSGDKMSGNGIETYTKTLVQRYTWTATQSP